MRQIAILLGWLIIAAGCQPPELTGEQAIERSIAYHDPDNTWPHLRARFRIRLRYPDGSERLSTIGIDRQNDIFSVEEVKDSDTVYRYLAPDTAYQLLNRRVVTDEDSVKKWRLEEERTTRLRDYYSYLYGLPMKLRDEGTIIGEEVNRVLFQGSDYLRVKVTYPEEVGSDIWYYYLDPATYALAQYQFYHNESENDGEYIQLAGEIKYGQMRIPKDRTWYTNDSSQLLGTDYLLEIEDLPAP